MKTDQVNLTARKKGFYERYVKRFLDILCALAAIIVFSWLFIIIAVLVRIHLGSPVIFKQPRPGMIDPETGRERIFNLYKFRTMTDARGKNGELLSDEQRMTRFGRILRGSSMDELPEAFNILKGDMSVVGPRPQLVRDMVFMTDEQRLRHTAKPGLSGLAQVKGRNSIEWEEKFYWDLQYIRNVSFRTDIAIIWTTVVKVFLPRRKQEGEPEETDLFPDYGDDLLEKNKITKERYDELQLEAQQLIAEFAESGSKT